MSALSLVSVQKPSNNKNPILQRRNKFAASIDSQIVKLGQFMEGKRVSRTSFWIDSGGTWFFEIKYGKQNVEPKKGLSVLKAINGGEDLIAQLEEIKTVAIAGGLDEALSACANATRANFKIKDKKAAGR